MATTKVNSEFIAVNAISGTIIADNAITATHIATNSISGTLVQDGGIVTTMIAANNVTSTKIVTDAVQTRHIADDQVTAAKLANSINTDIATGPAALPKAGGTMTGNLIGKAVTLAPDTAGKLTIRLTTNAANDGRIVIRSDTTDKVDIQANGLSYFNGGNVLVGKTADTYSVEGIALRGDPASAAALATFTRNGANPISLNRLTNDGDMLVFTKDGTIVGSIGTEATDIYIGTTDTGIRFNDAVNGVLPYHTSSGQTDNTLDLGFSSVRWKDLHLAGIASIGNLKIGTDQGTDGQVLTSTGSGVAWEDAAGGGPTFKEGGTNFTSSIILGDNATGTLNAASYNTGVGVDVFAALTSGNQNVAVGFEAGGDITTGIKNVHIGAYAAYRASDAQNNTAVGYASLSAASVGSNNTAIGTGALAANTAAANTAVGYNALLTTTTATQVTALGYRAGEDSTGSSNTFIGFLAGAETSTGNQNCFIGASTAESGVCTGHSNTAVGGNNFTGITSGSLNTVMGTHAMRNFQTGEGNVAIGYNAKRLHSSGDDAVVVGNHAAYNMTTGRTVVVGNEAFYTGTSTDDSVFIGNQAGYNVTTGYTNVIIGDRAGDTSLTTGYSNVIIGYKAGRSTNGFANTFVGSGSGTSTTGAYNTCIGNGANMANANNGGIAIGYAAAPGAAGTYATLAYGGSKSWISLGATGWSGSSDERLKENIRPSEAGLAFINDLKPVNFDWRKKKDIDPELETHVEDLEERYERDNPIGKIGFIAQDVKEALDNHPEVISHLWEEQEDGTQALTPNELIPVLVKAVQELSEEVEKLKNV